MYDSGAALTSACNSASEGAAGTYERRSGFASSEEGRGAVEGGMLVACGGAWGVAFVVVEVGVGMGVDVGVEADAEVADRLSLDDGVLTTLLGAARGVDAATTGCNCDCDCDCDCDRCACAATAASSSAI